ncbi:flavodoxin domain-containing protein [Amphibacillus jilinensis]|uniref:flavodoxin domain-containing protein n=1 Tax=Amphibacillus jilinensis TaxID=1216008 RepID=UPI0002F35334|nr:flavodoxin domain-containing protein [Amphibacillus jilinensis]
MKALVVYSSVTGNTSALAEVIYHDMIKHIDHVDFLTIDELDYQQLATYDVLAIGTYTWGNGELPPEMDDLYYEIEQQSVDHLITGIFGTGDSFYPYFCGAVDHFRDMLFVHTELAVTLKVELVPQTEDLSKVSTFCNRLVRTRVAV